MSWQPAQAAVARLSLHREDVVDWIEIQGGMEHRHPAVALREDPVADEDVEVDVGIEKAAETMHEGQGAKASIALCIRTALAKPRLHGAPRRTGRAKIPALAGEGDQEVVATAAAVGPRDTVGQDAALEILAEGPLDVERRAGLTAAGRRGR